MGSIGFVRIDQATRSAELGAAIGRAHWGRGFATRAAGLALDYGFSTLRLATIEAVVLPENARTLRILGQLGFCAAGDPCPLDRAVNGRDDCQFFVLERG